MTASIQLWSVREAAAQVGWAHAVAEVAEVGFTRVEPFAIDALRDVWASAIRELDLEAPSAHGFLDGERLAATLDAAEELGVGTVIHPHFDVDAWADESALDETAALLMRARSAAADRGLRVGFHNHEHELLHLVDGRPAFWRLLDRLPADVLVEYDIYWAAIAQVDISRDLRDLGSRVALLHIKDGPIGATAADQVALGDGALPLERLFESAPHALPVLSHDRMPGSADDLRTAVGRSAAWLRDRGML